MARPLEGHKTCLSNGMAIARLVLLLQPVADQKLDATLARFDRRNHDNALTRRSRRLRVRTVNVGS